MNKKFIDLFAGAGGMSCGLEMAGFQCLLGVDHEEAAIETFKYNHKYAQIQLIRAEQLIIIPQKIDI